MSAIIDILLVCIIVLSVYFCASKGFTKALLTALGFAISLAVALALCGFVGTTVEKSVVGEYVDQKLYDATEHISFEGVYGTDGKGGAQHAYLEKLAEMTDCRHSYERFYDDCAEWETHDDAALLKAFRQSVTPQIKAFLCKCAAFLMLFCIARAVLFAVEYILDKTVAFTEIKNKRARRVLGGTVGALIALLRINVFCIGIKLLLPLMSGFSEKMIPSSALLKFFAGISIGF